jgi:hypothetical protein
MEDLIFSVTSYFDASRVGDLSETGSIEGKGLSFA